MIGGRLSIAGETSSAILFSPYLTDKWVTQGTEKSFLPCSLDVSSLNGLYDVFAAENNVLCASPLPQPSYQKVTAIAVSSTGQGAAAWANLQNTNNGVILQTTSVCARTIPSNSGLANVVELQTSAQKVFRRLKLSGPSNDYIRGDGASIQHRIDIYTGGAWAPVATGTLAASEAGIYTIDFDNSAASDRIRILLAGNGVSAMNVAQVEAFEYSAATARFSQSGALRVNAAALGIYDPGDCTWLGTCNVENGIVSAHKTSGLDRKHHVWNFYNRLPVVLYSYLPENGFRSVSTSWTQTGAALSVVSGLEESPVSVKLNGSVFIQVFSTRGAYQLGISTDGASPVGRIATKNFEFVSAFGDDVSVFAEIRPFVGLKTITAIEKAILENATVKAFSGEDDSQMIASYLA